MQYASKQPKDNLGRQAAYEAGARDMLKELGTVYQIVYQLNDGRCFMSKQLYATAELAQHASIPFMNDTIRHHDIEGHDNDRIGVAPLKVTF